MDINMSLLMYHFSKERLAELRPLALQHGYRESYQSFQGHEHEIYMFPFDVEAKLVKLMRDNGFSSYGTGDITLHEVDVIAVLDSIDYFRLYSFPQEIDYHTTHWNAFYKKYRALTKERFKERRIEYRSKMYEDLGWQDRYLTEDLPKLQRILNSLDSAEYYFRLNAKESNKDQYATVIPHIAVSVSVPLPVNIVRHID